MEQLHSLLKRQLRRYVGDNGSAPHECPAFLEAVNQAYRQFDDDRAMLERTLELSSNELLQANSEMRAVFQALPDLFFRLDAEGMILDYKVGSSRDQYIPREKLLGKRIQDFPVGKVATQFQSAIATVLTKKTMTSFEYAMQLQGGEQYYEARLLPFVNDQIIAIVRNISERKLMQNQLAQAQKMESIGQLAAGIAHEINTPTQYVGDNVRFLRDVFADLHKLLVPVRQLFPEARSSGWNAPALAEAEQLASQIDIDYIVEEIPPAIQQSLEGIERIAKIVRSIKEFAHPDTGQKSAVDLNKAIESTITVARNEWKYVADLETDYDPDLPLVLCLPGDINQVVLNLIVNAAHAIADANGHASDKKGLIHVGTKRNDPWVDIRVSDNGTGIPDAIRARIFDPFFTTKEVGRGTGQGLAIAHTVVVEKHGGTINFETEAGKGTTFIVRLPQSSTY